MGEAEGIRVHTINPVAVETVLLPKVHAIPVDRDIARIIAVGSVVFLICSPAGHTEPSEYIVNRIMPMLIYCFLFWGGGWL
jgi:hypothetical protein